MRQLVLALAFGVAAGLPALAADYAPLDCAKASSAAQTAVCSNYLLGQQEARVATLFQWTTSFVGMGERGDMQDAQRAFLARREACGADLRCLAGAYAARISVLEAAMDRTKSKGPF